ncbi:hypothetical protein QYM36_008112 [Artemia franciscana]|uniref:Reverse transcriptase domain-containing protein n=1 Tax=Artemia franciscana TaxID=6661 RepID=A0AA88LKY2_ARTSF|nr:hypothetical protein QYM36_008112 [Artemia franciscana]
MQGAPWIKQSFKKGKAVNGIFLDMDSTFNRVDVGQLIRELSVLGLPDLLPGNVLRGDFFLHADDIAVAVVRRDPLCLQSASQKAVDMLSIWTNSNNMLFSTHKSLRVFFQKMHNLAAFKPQVKMNGQGIVVAEHARFLGVVFDRKMTWKPHLDERLAVSNKDKTSLMLSALEEEVPHSLCFNYCHISGDIQDRLFITYIWIS